MAPFEPGIGCRHHDSSRVREQARSIFEQGPREGQVLDYGEQDDGIESSPLEQIAQLDIGTHVEEAVLGRVRLCDADTDGIGIDSGVATGGYRVCEFARAAAIVEYESG